MLSLDSPLFLHDNPQPITCPSLSSSQGFRTTSLTVYDVWTIVSSSQDLHTCDILTRSFEPDSSQTGNATVFFRLLSEASFIKWCIVFRSCKLQSAFNSFSQHSASLAKSHQHWDHQQESFLNSGSLLSIRQRIWTRILDRCQVLIQADPLARCAFPRKLMFLKPTASYWCLLWCVPSSIFYFLNRSGSLAEFLLSSPLICCQIRSAYR